MASSKTKYVSKGDRRSINRALCRDVRADRTYLDKILFKQRAWKKGQNPWITISNPDKNKTNMLNIRVRAREYWGDPRAYVKIPSSDKN